MMIFYNLITILMVAPAVLVAIICHEYAHGWVSDRLGDPTPRASGRLSLNPLHHLDLWGTLCLLVFHVGWAKPVPVNPYYYKDRRKGMVMVALAGPCMNFLVAFLCVLLEGLLVKYGAYTSMLSRLLILAAEYCASINIGLGLFNLIPIPPLDGSKVLGELVSPADQFYRRWAPYWQWILIILLLLGVLSGPLSALSEAVFDGMWWIAAKILGLYGSGALTVI